MSRTDKTSGIATSLSPATADAPANGTRRSADGKESIFYDGYWIRYYPMPEDTLATRKLLIDHLTRRTFHHTETGINTPGEKLEEALKAYEDQTDPMKKRVNGAMLAGALFNRATDIFTAVVELESKGVRISHDNELMQQCGNCFKQALELGKCVRHHSGEEGIDELWGEPFKAFTQPLPQIFESRYRKIAQTMRDIERVAQRLAESLADDRIFEPVLVLLADLVRAAKLQLETMKSDNAFFSVWPLFVATRDTIDESISSVSARDGESRQLIDQGVKLVRAATGLITYLSEARVPMPSSTEQFMNQCAAYDRERVISTT